MSRARYKCACCGGATSRRAVTVHDYGSMLRRAGWERGIGAEWGCTGCGRRVQEMPLHRECEYGGESRMPSGAVRCGECARMLDGEEQDRIAQDAAYEAEHAAPVPA